ISTATAGNLTSQMELAWRDCTRYGGLNPPLILCGEGILYPHRVDCKSSIIRNVFMKDGMNKGVTLDGSVGSGAKTGLSFKGLEIDWDPVMSVLDALDAPEGQAGLC